MNSNFKRSIYMSGSPARENRLDPSVKREFDFNSTGGTNDSRTDNMNEINKQLKKDLLSHKFNLGYGKNTHKKAPSFDISQYSKDNMKNLQESKILKKKIEKQNFKYHEDIGGGKPEKNLLSVYGANKGRYNSSDYKKKELPMDYWKTNFSFNQISTDQNNANVENSSYAMNASTKSSKTDFSDIRSLVSKNSAEMNNVLRKNKGNAQKSHFTVGFTKGDFGTSYKNQYLWKVPKYDMA